MVRGLSAIPEWKRRWCLNRLSEEGVNKVRELYSSGVPIREIMKRLGITTPDCIYAFVDRRRRGNYRGRRRIDDDIVKEVVRLRERGLSLSEIARKLNISVGSVHRILKEKGLVGKNRETS